MLAFASSVAAGGAVNIAVSGIAAATASAVHLRARRVHWRLFLWMAPPGAAGAAAGGYLAGVAPERTLLLAIAAVLLYSGVDLLRWRVRPSGAGGPEPPRRLNLRAAVLASALIGLLGGFVGLILGALRAPAMLRLVGESPVRTVGTNLAVGVVVGAAGLVGHLPSASPDWDLLAAAGGASIPGALLGARLTGRLAERQLVRGIAIALLLAGAAALVQAFV